MQQLCLIAVILKAQKIEDVLFDHICLIYEFPLWCDRLSAVCGLINQMSSFPLSWTKSNVVIFKSATLTKVRNKQVHVFTQFFSRKRFPLPLNYLHCPCLLANQSWLSNKLMVCLVTLWHTWQCIEGGRSDAAWEHSRKWIIRSDAIQLREIQCMDRHPQRTHSLFNPRDDKYVGINKCMDFIFLL